MPRTLQSKCPQCGGPVPIAEGQTYIRCSYCSAESFVDLGGAILHQVIRPSISRGRVPGLLKSRATEAGRGDLTVTSLRLVYEPVWEMEGGEGRRVAISARAGLEGRFNLVKLPGGERVFADDRAGRGAEWLEPELAPESVPEVAARVIDRPVMAKRLRLIHRPVYAGHVTVDGQASDFQLDGATGELFDIDWPVEASYRKRNMAWLATGAMIAVATLLPLPAAAAGIVALGILAVALLRRRTGPSPAEAT